MSNMTFLKVLKLHSECSKEVPVKNTKKSPFEYTHRVISYKVHRLIVTLSYFWPDRFVQLLSLIPILTLLLYILVSIVLVYTGLRELVPE